MTACSVTWAQATGGLLNEPVSRWFTATTTEAVERLSEWAAAGAHRVMLQHQLWSDLETVALIGEGDRARTYVTSEISHHASVSEAYGVDGVLDRPWPAFRHQRDRDDATRPQQIWNSESACPRMTSAATAATGAFRIPMTAETEASTKRWPQFISTCPTPGTTARATIQGQSPAGIAANDSPEASAIGVMAIAAASQSQT